MFERIVARSLELNRAARDRCRSIGWDIAGAVDMRVWKMSVSARWVKEGGRQVNADRKGFLLWPKLQERSGLAPRGDSV